MWENSGDKKVFNGRIFECVRVVSDKAEADRLAGKIRDAGHLARATLRSKRNVPKETGYWAGHGGFTVTTYCVWRGPKK